MGEKEQPQPEKIIDIEGPVGITIFRRLFTWGTSSEALDVTLEGMSKLIQPKVDDMLQYVKNLNDDRLLVLVSALIIENAIDGLLAAIMPGYEPLREKRDFTFSMRIEIARALCLIPARILNCADFIRSLRNDVVHDLSIDRFDKFKPTQLQSMRDRLLSFTSEEQVESAEVFRYLATWTAVALYAYTIHVSQLDDFIRSDKLSAPFKTFLEQDWIDTST
jgi:hypothetical protein